MARSLIEERGQRAICTKGIGDERSREVEGSSVDPRGTRRENCQMGDREVEGMLCPDEGVSGSARIHGL
jgi:hypothetical protein